MASINDVPDDILADEVFWKVSLPNRLIQQRTCRSRELMHFSDESVNVIPLMKEVLELWHKEREIISSGATNASL